MRLIIFSLLLAGSATALADDFRGLPWGASEEDLLEREGEPAHVLGECRIYPGQLLERPVQIVYCLNEVGLYRGGYVFKQIYAPPYQKHIDDYQLLLDRLSARYGAPARNTVDWSGDRLRVHRSHWGARLATGDLELRTEWEADDKHVAMTLRLDEALNISHYLSYQSAERLTQQREREAEAL